MQIKSRAMERGTPSVPPPSPSSDYKNLTPPFGLDRYVVHPTIRTIAIRGRDADYAIFRHGKWQQTRRQPTAHRIQVRVQGKQFLLSRLVVECMTQRLLSPNLEVDHIEELSSLPDDTTPFAANRWTNLQVLTRRNHYDKSAQARRGRVMRRNIQAKDLEEEEWRTVIDYATDQPISTYLVSNFGRFKTRKTNILRRMSRNTIMLFHNGKSLARIPYGLACRTWHGPRPNKTFTVDHINNNRSDLLAYNHVSNLRWACKKTQARNRECAGLVRTLADGSEHTFATCSDAVRALSLPVQYITLSRRLGVPTSLGCRWGPPLPTHPRHGIILNNGQTFASVQHAQYVLQVSSETVRQKYEARPAHSSVVPDTEIVTPRGPWGPPFSEDEVDRFWFETGGARTFVSRQQLQQKTFICSRLRKSLTILRKSGLPDSMGRRWGPPIKTDERDAVLATDEATGIVTEHPTIHHACIATKLRIDVLRAKMLCQHGALIGGVRIRYK